MMLKRKLNCGYNGFDFSNIPKAPRSWKRKVACKRADGDDCSKICGIDLLASLAEKLLEEKESSSSNSAFQGDKQDRLCVKIKQEHQDCISEFPDQGNPLAPKANSENTSETCLQFSSLENDCILKQTPCKRENHLVACESKKGDCGFLVESGSFTEDTGFVTADTMFEDGEEARDGLIADTSNGFKLPLGMDDVPNDSFEGYGNHSKLGFRDGDEKYCRYYKLSEKCNSYRALTRVTNRRISKSMAKKYGRAFLKTKCFEDMRTDACLKALHRKRKLCHGHNPWKNRTIHRKRRLSAKGLVVNSDEGLSYESVTNSRQRGDRGLYKVYTDILHYMVCMVSHVIFIIFAVKLSIKSLRIPELFIKVPKTATVGSLKRTVKEAVTALLGGGICIGVLLQGKKVRDDNNTLSHAGLSCVKNLDKFGFTLKPLPQKLIFPLFSQNSVVSMPTESTDFQERY
ncbi:unnamed protein product [Cochlearia groenlandica]